MNLLFLGTGPAFGVDPNNYQSNMVLRSPGGRNLLIDCGSDVRYSLLTAGLHYREITDIYISHLHADHVGGLEYMGFATRFDAQCGKPHLYIAEDLADTLWENSLSGGMRIIGGRECTIEDFFRVERVDADGVFEWEGVRFELVPAVHVEGESEAMLSYGLFFSVDGVKVFLTTDTKFTPEALGRYLEEADLIFHDCETSPHRTGVHPHYNELVTLPDHIKNKTWLYHHDENLALKPVEDGFLGYVKCGQSFDLSEIGRALVQNMKLQSAG